MFGAKKYPSRSWNENVLQFNGLMMPTNASPTLALECIVNYADPDPIRQENGLGADDVRRRSSGKTCKGKLTLMKNDDVIFYVDLKHNVLVARLEPVAASCAKIEEPIMNVVDASVVISSPVVTTDTPMACHAHFGHLALDTIEYVAKDPASGIKISHHDRKLRMVRAVGKQTRAQQPTKNTWEHASIDKLERTSAMT
ncbi:hypothetical protein PInf_009134 [Phytophthora infestans]|nr:hypothetical protein PInf_009134 [Phytophthora infestans]